MLKFALLCCILFTHHLFAADTPVSFSREIAPILADQCLACHKESKALGSYRVDSYEQLMQSGDSGDPPITVGKPQDSYLHALLVSDDEDERMPQKADTLPQEQLNLFKRWIEEGAIFDGKDPQQSISSLLPQKRQTSPEKYPNPQPIISMVWNHDSSKLYVGGFYELLIYDVESRQLIQRIAGLPERSFAIALHPTLPLLAAAGGTPGKSGQVILLNLDTQKIEWQSESQSDCELAVDFSADGQWMVFGGTKSTVNLFELATRQMRWSSTAHADWISHLKFAPDSQHFASASRDRTAKVFELNSTEPKITQTTHGVAVTRVAFSADSTALYSSGNLGDLRRCELAATVNGAGVIPTQVIHRRSQEITALQAIDRNLYTTNATGWVVRHNIQDISKPQRHTFYELKERAESMQVSGDQRYLAIGTRSGKIILHPLKEGVNRYEFIAAPGWNS